MDKRKLSKVEKATVESLRERIRLNHKKVAELQDEIERLKKDTRDTHAFLCKLEGSLEGD